MFGVRLEILSKRLIDPPPPPSLDEKLPHVKLWLQKKNNLTLST